MTTDDAGKIRFNGFLGEYVLDGGVSEAAFQLESAGAATIEVRLG
jgi:hypothetical protein